LAGSSVDLADRADDLRRAEDGDERRDGYG